MLLLSAFRASRSLWKWGRKRRSPEKAKRKQWRKQPKLRRRELAESPRSSLPKMTSMPFWYSFLNSCESCLKFCDIFCLREKWVLKLLCVWSYIGLEFNFGTVMLYVKNDQIVFCFGDYFVCFTGNFFERNCVLWNYILVGVELWDCYVIWCYMFRFNMFMSERDFMVKFMIGLWIELLCFNMCWYNVGFFK